MVVSLMNTASPRGTRWLRPGIAGEHSRHEEFGMENRRLIEENRKWRERCERLEVEREEAREEINAMRLQIEHFHDKWEEREVGTLHRPCSFVDSPPPRNLA